MPSTHAIAPAQAPAAAGEQAHPLTRYGSPKGALKRFTDLHRLPRALKPEERVEYDTIGGAFADLRNLLKRFDDINL